MGVGRKTGRISIATGMLGLATVSAVLVPACSTASSDSGAAASNPATSSPSALPRAQQLLTKPTAALVKQAGADHVLTGNEQTLVAVYWSFLANAHTTGEYDPVFLKSGLQDAVVHLASKYPSFFRAADARSQVAFVLESSPGQTIFTCAESCIPTSTLNTMGILSAAVSAIDTVLGATQASTALGLLFNTAKIALTGATLESALTSLATANTDQVLSAVHSVAGAIVGGTATVIAVTASLAEAAGVVAVAAIYSGITIAIDVIRAIDTLDSCTNFQSLSCCPNGICNNPPHTSCSGGKIVSSQPAGTCTNGLCTYLSQAPMDCPVDQFCPNGDSVCRPILDAGLDSGDAGLTCPGGASSLRLLAMTITSSPPPPPVWGAVAGAGVRGAIIPNGTYASTALIDYLAPNSLCGPVAGLLTTKYRMEVSVDGAVSRLEYQDDLNPLGCSLGSTTTQTARFIASSDGTTLYYPFGWGNCGGLCDSGVGYACGGFEQWMTLARINTTD